MIYDKKTVTLKDGRQCVMRSAAADDAKAVLDVFILTHEQTDYLLTYPDENTFTVEQEREFLQKTIDSDNEISILAEVDGIVIGSAGVECIGDKCKLRHRASFGIGIDKAYWGLGIGIALTEACIESAKSAGYSQLELDVVADNIAALSLYKKAGFVEYGRNPRGFRSRLTGWQELVLMRMELTDHL